MSLDNVNTCNVEINGEKYFSDAPNLGLQALSDVGTIAFNFPAAVFFGSCFICLIVLSAILFSTGSSPIALIILACCSCICASYNYYNYNNAKNDLADMGNKFAKAPNSRPCKDPKSGNLIK